MQYRQLDVDDTIGGGDQVDMCNDGWRDAAMWKVVSKACPHMVGEHPSDPRYPAHTRYRRPERNPATSSQQGHAARVTRSA
jgi:hypothetical protein